MYIGKKISANLAREKGTLKIKSGKKCRTIGNFKQNKWEASSWVNGIETEGILKF